MHQHNSPGKTDFALISQGKRKESDEEARGRKRITDAGRKVKKKTGNCHVKVKRDQQKIQKEAK